MNYKKKIILYIFIFNSNFYFLSNSYFSYEESLIFGGADGKSYFDISKYSPYLSEEPIQPIHAERFFSYLIGLISKTLFIEIYTLNRIFVIFIIVLINKYIIDFFKIK